MRRKRIALFAASGLVGLALLGCPPAEETPPEQPPPAEPALTPGEPRDRADLPPGVTGDQVSMGEELFRGRANCYTCHAMDGTGTALGPDLTDGEWVHISHDLGQIERNIREGVARPVQYPAPMPPMGGARLTDEEIRAVAAYVYVISGD